MAEKLNEFSAITNEKPTCRDVREGKSCYRREEVSKVKGGHRAFQDYRSRKMCQPCQIHWHLSLASQQMFHEANLEGQ